jgi:hypothetical protein
VIPINIVFKSDGFRLVVTGLVPAIHVFFLRGNEDVDARHKAGHDELIRDGPASKRETVRISRAPIKLSPNPLT